MMSNLIRQAETLRDYLRRRADCERQRKVRDSAQKDLDDFDAKYAESVEEFLNLGVDSPDSLVDEVDGYLRRRLNLVKTLGHQQDVYQSKKQGMDTLERRVRWDCTQRDAL